MHHTSTNIIGYKAYLILKNYQKASIKKYVSQAKNYENYTAKKQETITEYYHYLKSKNLNNSTLNNYLQSLKSYADYLKSTHQKSFYIPLLREKITPENIDYLTLEEIKFLFETTKKRPKFKNRDQAVLGCLYHLGLRASEATNLTLEDIDLENNLVFIRKSKTGYQRQVPISETLKTIFEKYLQTRMLFFSMDNNYFLLGLKGKLTANGSIPQILNKLAKETQISKRIHPHVLRHSIATHLLQNGMPLDKVSQFLGHKNIGSTERYTHL